MWGAESISQDQPLSPLLATQGENITPGFHVGNLASRVPCYLHIGLNCCTKFHVTPIALVWKTIHTKLTSSGWMRISQRASASAVAAKQMWLKQSKFTGIILPCQRSANDIERCYIVSRQCTLTAGLTKKRDTSSKTKKKARPPREGSEAVKKQKKEEKHNRSNSGRSTFGRKSHATSVS